MPPCLFLQVEHGIRVTNALPSLSTLVTRIEDHDAAKWTEPDQDGLKL